MWREEKKRGSSTLAIRSNLENGHSLEEEDYEGHTWTGLHIFAHLNSNKDELKKHDGSGFVQR